MAASIGDLTLNILLKVSEAEKGAKQFTATLKDMDAVLTRTKKPLVDLSDKTAKFGFVLNGVREAGAILSSSLRGVFTAIQNSNLAFQQLSSSGRQLEATSKLTGVSLGFLKKTSEESKSAFQLSTIEANKFTIELTKLGQKAGDTQKVSQSIGALLDLGAAQGLDTTETLNAIKQAVLGIDEGTDKLFQKNPTVLYDVFSA